MSGIPLGFSERRVQPGLHLCYIYNDDEERIDLLSRFFEAGVEAREKLLYVADGTPVEEVPAMLSRGDAPLPGAPTFRVATARETYFPEGRFEADGMMALLRSFHVDAVTGGYAGARLAAEMTWMLGEVQGSEGAIPYEARVTRTLAEHPITAICQYDARRFSGETLMDMLSVHPFMVVRGQVVENPYYVHPDVFLARRAPSRPH
ncbi:MAG: MEDS domain-containing protein [Myxococcota bacterium]